MFRIALALFVLFALTAFAPAPFPKTRRNNEVTTLQSCQGLWAVRTMESVGDGGLRTKSNWGVSHIRIREDRWTLLNNGSEQVSYRIAVDGTKTPSHIDWLPLERNQNTVLWIGVVKRQGNTAIITYTTPASGKRPESIDRLPSQTYLYTVEKVNE